MAGSHQNADDAAGRKIRNLHAGDGASVQSDLIKCRLPTRRLGIVRVRTRHGGERG